MRKEKLKGWLFDHYPFKEGMVLWILTREGTIHRLLHQWSPSFYVHGKGEVLEKVSSFVERLPIPSKIRITEKQEFFTNRYLEVLEITPLSPLDLPRIFRNLISTFRDLAFFNTDISPIQLYCFEKGLFPMGLCSVEWEDDWIRSICPEESALAIDYEIPPMKSIFLRLEGCNWNPSHGKRGRLEVTIEEEAHILEGTDRAIIKRLADILRNYDPDIIFTQWGDTVILPELEKLSLRSGIPLPLNREKGSHMEKRSSRSYFSYGRIIYAPGSVILKGRWHIDVENSFIFSESGLCGLIELARLSRIPVQRLARQSPGTAISSMQLLAAYRRGYLIPWRKTKPENFKTASTLLLTDKGGLTYIPPVGFFENVAELDFSSMYPAIMFKYNISPETVNCTCCEHNRIPEIGYHVCTVRKGIVPEVLSDVIKKREIYKKKRDRAEGKEKEVYESKQGALKWILVTCFGYLGYKNARFGRIEAHETVTAISREILLKAKEIAEERGFHLLHAIVDSMWLKKDGAERDDYINLCREISEKTGLTIALEGIYRWICFLPSRTNPSVSVHNRFYGVFTDGKLKIRGIEMRRHDTPPLIAACQREIMEIMKRACTVEELKKLIPQITEIVKSYLIYLREGRAKPEELVIRKRLSLDPENYKVSNLNAIVSRKLISGGVRLHPGEEIEYIITKSDSKMKEERAQPFGFFNEPFTYDTQKYSEMLEKSVENLLGPLISSPIYL